MLFPLALAAPLLVPALAQAQDASGRAQDAASATTASPPAAAPPGSAVPSPGAAPAGTPPGAAPAPTEAPRPARPALIAPSPDPSAPAVPAARVVVSPPPPSINPAHDQQALAAQGSERPSSSGELGNPQEVFSEDWWGHARPVFEVHGFFRTRAELFHNLFLNRHSSSLVTGSDPQQLWPIPLDQSYSPSAGGKSASVNLCGPATPLPTQSCYDKTESGANVRLRLDPEIHISDNLRILSEVDALDNLVLGSTPNSYAMQPVGTTAGTTVSGTMVGVKTGYMSAGYNPYASLGFFSTTQGPPTAGVNSWTNSVEVKRVWGEYMTPVGQLRFGRMPSHWGLGMVDNAGDGIDSDYQTTVDRIMFVTGIKSMDLYFGGMWDFVSTGPTTTPGAATSPAFNVYGGQPYNNCNLCNVNEWAAFVAHRTNPELQKLELARGDVVINGGLYTKFRSQYLDVAA
ncbi:MAG TPA: hypothetical protein VK841_03975, partial [Polyangiaceae bacterium]|nr:hypothetical protein [Polyangiaceae bacterium]